MIVVRSLRKRPVRKHQQTFTIAETPLKPGELDSKHILTPEQLAERLKVEVSWVYEQTRKRASRRNTDPLPSISLGKYLRFYWPEIERWLERRQSKPGGQNETSRRVHLAQGS
jgi:predicted DNA-binding transcriptional regulator AlpA